MNSGSTSAPDGSILNIPSTDTLFLNQIHIFSLVIRKKGKNATYGSGLGLDIPNRYAAVSVIVKVGLLSVPQLSIKCAKL